MKYSELEVLVSSVGCYLFRNGRNHPIWYSPITKKMFPMSYHKSQEVKIGTLRSIKKSAGVI